MKICERYLDGLIGDDGESLNLQPKSNWIDLTLELSSIGIRYPYRPWRKLVTKSKSINHSTMKNQTMHDDSIYVNQLINYLVKPS